MRKTKPGRKEYRSKLDIIAEILRASIDGASKTRIVYSAALSHAQCKYYLSWMVDKGLLVRSDITYMPSKNGLEFLNVYMKQTKKLDSLIPLGLDLKTRNARHFAKKS